MSASVSRTLFKQQLAKAGLLIRCAVVAAALIVIFNFVDFSGIPATVKSANKNMLALTLALWLPNLSLQAVKWFFILKSVFPQARFREAVRSFFGALSLGFITPGRAGELGKAVFLPNYHWQVVSALAVIDTLTLLTAKIIWGFVAVYFYPHEVIIPTAPTQAKTTAFVAILAGALFLLGLLLRFAPGLRKKFTTAAAKIRESLAAANQTRIAIAFLLSLLFVALFSTQFALVVHALHPLEVVPATSAAVLTNITKSLLPISFGDLGVREGAAIFIFGKLGVPAAVAVTSALFIFTLNVAIPALIGLPILWQVKQKKRASAQ